MKSFRSLFTIFLFLLFTQTGQAAANTASKFIDELGSHALETVADKSLNEEQRQQQFRKILQEAFAVKGIAKFVIGRHWRLAKEEEKERYLGLFEDYVIYTYMRYFNNYSGQTFKVTGERDAGAKGVLVSMHVENGNNPPIMLQWQVRFSEKKNNWLIVDVNIEGVSMALTQRSEFASVINKHGGKVSPFLDDLEARIARAKAQQAK